MKNKSKCNNKGLRVPKIKQTRCSWCMQASQRWWYAILTCVTYMGTTSLPYLYKSAPSSLAHTSVYHTCVLQPICTLIFGPYMIYHMCCNLSAPWPLAHTHLPHLYTMCWNLSAPFDLWPIHPVTHTSFLYYVLQPWAGWRVGKSLRRAIIRDVEGDVPTVTMKGPTYNQ